ncbi:SAM-dependent methyltransferase [Paenibacillus sp. N4]|uniref:class I SAM-dependent methyltransferase n=1 Tax=Paenibacillus vietnamensis TaxID=2590547 RepID=UPI001CD18923|nr:SAM-dependent methyltransferase [Paenibacillus vietnamensis]MCA0753811.1 SAM-dependent methyltransferase [Paenibacillus vietnamensis]
MMTKTNELATKLEKRISASVDKGWQQDKEGKLRAVGCISFKEFMAACLYDDEYGYYRSGPVRIGKNGDFYTSSGIGAIMAEVLARYALAYANAEESQIQLVEWGAGTGRLSAQIAAAGRTLDMNWESRFSSVLVEDHPMHREAVQRSYRELAGRECAEPLLLSSKEAWDSGILKRKSLVLANELLDAFPVHRVAMQDGELVELGVGWSKEQGFYEVYMPVTDPRLVHWLESDGISLKEGQRTEVHAAAYDFLQRLRGDMPSGRLVLIDYGHEAEEYAAEHRRLGTLMCYWKHQASGNPYVRIGVQDITSHVPFTFVRRAAEDAGWKLAGYTTQKQFLLDNGVLGLLQSHDGSDPFGEAARINRAVRQLLLSDEMSEAFKVMVLDA